MNGNLLFWGVSIPKANTRLYHGQSRQGANWNKERVERAFGLNSLVIVINELTLELF
jgi:hypothetical protein